MLTVKIHTDQIIGTVSPRLYGHFAEHLGRCCYNGFWVGQDSKIENIRGFRKDVIHALGAISAPLVRWPGGCYADHYHWRDGIGPPEKRPRRLGMSCGLQTEDDNSLGTHEFLDFCGLVGAEPYLAGNVGSGTVQEMCDWLEYCNSDLDTDLAIERKANGRGKPFGVKLWGVGNENWGCGGCFEPESYGLEFRGFACMLKHVDPASELVVCGHDSEWNRRLVKTLSNHSGLVDHFSIHRYWIEGGPGDKYSEADYYRLLNEVEGTEQFVKDTRALLDEIDPKRRIGIALDEWGVWHPEARGWGPGAKGDISGEYSQPATHRDAIMAAVAFEGFHRQCAILTMANLAQIVNVLHAPILTDGAEMVLTPTYYAFLLHVPHMGGAALSAEVEGSELVSATATLKEGVTTVTIVNRNFRDEATVWLPFEPASVHTLVEGAYKPLQHAKNQLTLAPQSITTAMDSNKAQTR